MHANLTNMSVSLQHISKSFGAQQVLQDICLDIPVGQILGLLGPNGAGKSTLMKILIGLWRADSGSVAAPARIGYLPENNPLYDDMYVVEYLRFMAKLTRKDEMSATTSLNEEMVNCLVERVGLTSERHKHIRELSKGYRQRVGLAQALIGNPDLLILDEPTTGLDPNQLVEIRSLIKNFAHGRMTGLCPNDQRPMTIILSSHIMQEVREMCDRVVILDHGQIKADKMIGEVDDLETLFHKTTK